ncbi:hypothetical protein PINS_up005413 [Pythium insidiosum]|nr:hypothetical protein PINS_up005413 [Pythium insidiosum]
MNTLTMFSLKRRVESFSSDDSFDVLSMEDFDAIDSSQDAVVADDVGADVDADADADAEWEDIPVPEAIAMDEDCEPEASFVEDSIEEPNDVVAPEPARRPSAREALRDFYLMRARESEEESKKYRADAWAEDVFESNSRFWRSPVIAPLRAPERYPVDVVERVLREENARKAKLALRSFYAQRAMEKERRASLNRANEAFLRQSQRGFGCNQVLSEWEAALSPALNAAS